MLEDFIAQKEGTVVSVDGVPANSGQSEQLVAAWCQHIGLPFQWANPADWWDGSDSNFLDYWNRTELVEGGLLPQSGDIVVFSTALPGSGHLGHLSIFLGLSPDNTGIWEGFDANWGGKSAHKVQHTWSYVLGFYSPKNKHVLEGATPIPIADETPFQPYEIQLMEARIVRLNVTAKLYNLRNVDYLSFVSDPVQVSLAGTEVVVSAIAKHRLGGQYYMPDAEKAEGYRLEDCEGDDDDTIVGQEDIPELIDDNPHGPSAPMLAPSKTDVIHVPFDIPKYGSYMGAAEKNPSMVTGQLHSGRYFVYKRLGGMLHITPNLGYPTGIWINPNDMQGGQGFNEIKYHGEPVKIDRTDQAMPRWRETYKPFKADNGLPYPRYYVARSDGHVIDQETGREVPIRARQPILISGYFTGPDGNIYARPAQAAEQFSWYGIDAANIEPEQMTAAMPPEEPETPTLPGFRGKLQTVLQNRPKWFDVIKPKQQSTKEL